MAAVTEITSLALFDAAVQAAGRRVVVAYFWAPWAAPSLQMAEVLAALAQSTPALTFIKVEAEAVPEVSEKLAIELVPTTVFLQGGVQVHRISGANPPELGAKVQQYAAVASSTAAAAAPAATAATATTATAESPAPSTAPAPVAAAAAAGSGLPLETRLRNLVNFAPVMVFIKGEPNATRCGFSRQLVELLTKHKAKFGSFDILSDDEVRQGLKTFSNWPTYPQLYVNGKLIGGLDIIKEMDEAGELAALLPKDDAARLQRRLEALTKSSRVMVFIKGEPDAPRCGFSRQLLELLRATGVVFGSFDILSDDEVRQGLKAYSNWPTYPQLYVNGQLIGGLDIVKEMHEAGELAEVLQA